MTAQEKVNEIYLKKLDELTQLQQRDFSAEIAERVAKYEQELRAAFEAEKQAAIKEKEVEVKTIEVVLNELACLESSDQTAENVESAEVAEAPAGESYQET